MKTGSIWDRTPTAGRVLLVAFLILYVGGGLIAGTVGLLRAAHGADLALPKKPAERCLTPGENPSPGQTLHADKSCKSGMRWVFQK